MWTTIFFLKGLFIIAVLFVVFFLDGLFLIYIKYLKLFTLEKNFSIFYFYKLEAQPTEPVSLTWQ